MDTKSPVLFRFKQFHVEQTNATMKINTDGVLLGALADHPSPNRILDIGSGTGVIAMMMAQRFPHAIIDAVEKDELAAQLSDKNFKNSIFFNRIRAHCTLFQEFAPPALYDLIVSNPPFFLNALQNPDKRKSIARHTDASFYRELIQKAWSWLNDGGQLQLVLPPVISTSVREYADKLTDFHPAKAIHIKSFESEDAFRQIICLRKGERMQPNEDTIFTIYKERGIYSNAYKELLKPFFVNF
ncbi:MULTISPECIES: tRNA1(Val) (adenine(37)-N6)-methyltransferase [Olivibacter]|uniref:tRNA1(Val) (adenine(37)-N6)-methyltransferase n=4 Tax=Sphingobacteriaceae TaxID=84566 RepID=F4C8A2_SPHS2|nr:MULTISPECIES: methyltransferase [Olivibacter]MCL4638964.1 methyltransferase [Olivibacter sp. UJ_SKK_5.1]MDX3913993.1 methyltransferase [Pseudosphingobacterium sp.]QEL02140.1 methyltransferase [Olivibacter sp. LS-1]